jgi:hypothetical protein
MNLLVFCHFLVLATAQLCVVSDVDTTPIARDFDAQVCRSVQALSCCPLSSQPAIRDHIADRARLLFSNTNSNDSSIRSSGACAFNALQLLCAALCSVEQALVARVQPVSSNASLSFRHVVFPVDSRYVADLWRSCRLRCDRETGATFDRRFNASAFLSQFDGVLRFLDYNVPLEWHFQFVPQLNASAGGPALLASRAASLARAPCGPDDVPCNATNTDDFVSALPSCDVPTTIATTLPPSTTPVSPPLAPSQSDSPIIIPVVCGILAIFLVGIVGCVLLARQCRRPPRAEPLEFEVGHELDENGLNRPRRRPVSSSPARQVAQDRRRSAARRQSRRLADEIDDENTSDGDDAVNSMDSAASEQDRVPSPCSVCSTALIRREVAFWCESCNACRRGLCLYCDRIGREDALFCRKCHKLLPGMLPAPDTAALDGDCAICLDSFDEQAAVELPCKHVLHRSCFMTWFAKSPKHNNLCPICKQKLKSGALE